MYLGRGVTHSPCRARFDPGDLPSNNRDAPPRVRPTSDPAPVPAVPQSDPPRTGMAHIGDGTSQLLAKLIQLTRFGLGAGSRPLLEPARKRS